MYAVRQVIEKQTLRLRQVRAIQLATGSLRAIDRAWLDRGVDNFSSDVVCVCRIKSSINLLQAILINLMPPRVWFIELVL